MSVIFGLDNVPREPRGRAVAVGVFDGVHWGHKAILEQLQKAAADAGIEPLALTFEKHPAELLSPTRAPEYINTLDQRIELMQAAGASTIVVADFSPPLANLPREEFLSMVLRETLQCRRVVVGSNFRFGKDRAGDSRYLNEAAPALGMSVSIVPAVIIQDGPVSSTRIRALISRGDVEAAANLLGRRFALRGSVVQGRQVGATIGFPTANIQTAPRQLVPARGVYAVEVNIDGITYSGACNIGTRPTFDSGSLSVEVHLSDFEGNLYGRQLDVGFCRRIRDEMTFENVDDLVAQIRHDLERATGGC